MEKKTRILFIGVPISLLLLTTVFLILLVFMSRQPVLVEFATGEYARGEGVLLALDRALLLIDGERFRKEQDARNHRPIDPSWGLWPVGEVKLIEFLPRDQDEGTAGSDGDYAGTWRINAEGNHGYIFLAQENGRYTGVIRFPKYALGKTEVMRNLAIEGRKITFVRSANTSAELRRLGVSTPFRQEYTGWFNPAGTYVKGQYVIPGSIRNWNGYRVGGKK